MFSNEIGLIFPCFLMKIGGHFPMFSNEIGKKHPCIDTLSWGYYNLPTDERRSGVRVVKKQGNSLILRNDIYQSNPLIHARKSFDLLGMKIFMLGLRGLNPHVSKNDKYFDADFKEILIPTSTLTELFGNTWYLGELKAACRKLFDSVVELNYADGGFELYHLFRKLKYVPSKGLFIWFDELLRPYILDLFQTRGYTRINVEYMFKLSSTYAIRLLELLLQYQNIKEFKELMEIKRKMTVEELRFALNVPEGAYNSRMDHFRKFVLDNPIKEIITRTPYSIRYTVVKEGRNVIAFEFVMDTYDVPKNDEDNHKASHGNDAITALCSLGFTERDARAIFAKCQDTEDCFSRINRSQAILARSKKPIENRLGFLREAIEKNWQVGRRSGTKKQELGTRGHEEQETGSFAMTPIGEILKSINLVVNSVDSIEDSAPNRPQPLKVGKKEMPFTLAKTFIKYIKRGERLASIRENLRMYGTTIEKFTELCEEHEI